LDVDATGKKTFTVGQIIIVFFAIIVGLFNLGNASPFLTTLTTARSAAFEVYNIIDRVGLNHMCCVVKLASVRVLQYQCKT
jgi:hypothetical protein